MTQIDTWVDVEVLRVSCSFCLVTVLDSTNQEGPRKTSGTGVHVPRGSVVIIARDPQTHGCSNL